MTNPTGATEDFWDGYRGYTCWPNRDLIASLQRQIETERSRRLLAERRAALLEQTVVQLRIEIFRLAAEPAALGIDPE